jgi:hypothetical protein
MQHPRPAAVAATLLFLSLGCRSVYFVEVADSPGVPAQIEHCLSSLGLKDHSSEPKVAEQIASDSKVVAIWASQHHESRWHLGATAFVQRDADQWKLRFIPGPPGSEDSVVVFAEGFSRCLALHDPEIDVEVIASRRLDLW